MTQVTPHRVLRVREPSRGVTVFVTGNLAVMVSVCAAGWAGGFFLWSSANPDRLEPLLLANRLAPAQRDSLLAAVLLGMGVALAVGVCLAVVAHLSGRDDVTWLRRYRLLVTPTILLAFLPVLALPGLQTNQPFLVLFLVAALALVTFIAANDAARNWGPALAWRGPAINTRAALALTILLAAGYAGYMIVLTLARHAAFETHSFDLGIHDQVIYTVLRDGYMRSTQHGVNPINYLGEHFSPILYLVAPLYALRQDARSLLVLQSLALAAGAIPVYLLARAKTRHTALALSLAACYLLYPALQGVNTFDFHQIALATPLLLWALYFLESGHDRLFLLFLALALATKEEVALTVAAFGCYLFLIKRRYRLGLALTVLGAAYFLIVVGYVMPSLGGVPQVYRFEGLMAEGPTGLSAVIKSLLTNPVYALVYIFTNPAKLLFLGQLLLPVLCLPLLARGAWLVAVPAFSVALLASHEPNFLLGMQYPAIMVPFVFFLVIAGVQRLDPGKYARGAIAAAVLVATLAMNYEYGWLFSKEHREIPQPNAHQQILAGFFGQIPVDASVSTLSDIVPHLSARENIYLFPMTSDADYILFDAAQEANLWPLISRDPRSEAARVLAPLIESKRYGLVQAQDGILLLKRGYDSAQNAAALRAIYTTRLEAESMRSDYTDVDRPDEQASAGLARVGEPASQHPPDKEALTFGPFASMRPGKYHVTFVLKVDETRNISGATTLTTLDVFSHTLGGSPAGRDLALADFAMENQYQPFSFDLEISQALDDVEYRVLYKGQGRLWVDYVEIVPAESAVLGWLH